MSQWPGFGVWDEWGEGFRADPGTGYVRVRWGLSEDEIGVAKLLELNGMPRWVAFEERFLVAEREGEILAALRYQMAPKQLLLGLLVTDPWAEERPLARALYPGAVALAREADIGEVCVRHYPYGDYPGEAGYRRGRGGWRANVALSREDWSELPSGGWRRILALLGAGAVPFFRAFRD
jgi:hypothetical protein